MGGLLLIVILCYCAGRVHQYAKAGLDRESAYREGYDTATHSLFGLATRVAKRSVSAPPSQTREMPRPEPRKEFRPVPVTPMPPSVPQDGIRRPRTRRGPRHAA